MSMTYHLRLITLVEGAHLRHENVLMDPDRTIALIGHDDLRMKSK